MTFNNPLEAVYQAYLVSHESLLVVEQIIRENNEVPMPRFELLRSANEDVKKSLVKAAQQADDLAVFALFATFERYVIERLQTAHERLASGYPSGYSRKLAEKFKSEVEYWRFDEILDLFKPELDVGLIGRVKQIKRYRDWIAHRNANKALPSPTAPGTVFEVLSKALNELHHAHEIPSTPDWGSAADQQSPISVCRDHSRVYRQA